MIYPDDIVKELGNVCGHNDCAGELDFRGRNRKTLWWVCLECRAETHVDLAGNSWTEPPEVPDRDR